MNVECATLHIRMPIRISNESRLDILETQFDMVRHHNPRHTHRIRHVTRIEYVAHECLVRHIAHSNQQWVKTRYFGNTLRYDAIWCDGTSHIARIEYVPSHTNVNCATLQVHISHKSRHDILETHCNMMRLCNPRHTHRIRPVTHQCKVRYIARTNQS